MGAARTPPERELRRDFRLAADRFVLWPVGFESECWIADGRWFIKVWNDREPPVDLALLGALADAALPVPRPLRADLARTDDGRPYAVFPYVRGRHATDDDCVEVARLLRQVHDLPTDGLVLPVPPLSDEPLDLLRPRLSHPWIADRTDELVASLDRFESVLARARAITVRPGVGTWGFERLARVDDTLALC